MDRAKANFVIDGVLFLCLMAMAGIGLLLKYVLLPGRELSASYGSKVRLTLFGWDRHDWGELHLVIGYVFLGLLLVHVVLHWKQIRCMFGRLLPRRLHRIIAATSFGAASILALGFALFVSPEVAERGRGGGHGRDQGLHRARLDHGPQRGMLRGMGRRGDSCRERDRR